MQHSALYRLISWRYTNYVLAPDGREHNLDVSISFMASRDIEAKVKKREIWFESKRQNVTHLLLSQTDGMTENHPAKNQHKNSHIDTATQHSSMNVSASPAASSTFAVSCTHTSDDATEANEARNCSHQYQLNRYQFSVSDSVGTYICIGEA